MEYTPRDLDQVIGLSEGIFMKTSHKLIRICGFSIIYRARPHKVVICRNRVGITRNTWHSIRR